MNTLGERLVVAVDPQAEVCSTPDEIRKYVLDFTKSVASTGVTIKLNSSTLRTCGYSLILEVKEYGVRVFSDAKFHEIPSIMAEEAKFLRIFQPDLVTVMCCAGVDGMRAVQDVLGDTAEIIGVTVLTSHDDDDCDFIFGCSTTAGILKFARMAKSAELRGLVLSPHELEVVTKRQREFDFKLSTPGIRLHEQLIPCDDQVRFLSPREAFDAGSDRIIVGRPITQSDSPVQTIQSIKKQIENLFVN